MVVVIVNPVNEMKLSVNSLAIDWARMPFELLPGLGLVRFPFRPLKTTEVVLV